MKAFKCLSCNIKTQSVSGIGSYNCYIQDTFHQSSITNYWVRVALHLGSSQYINWDKILSGQLANSFKWFHVFPPTDQKEVQIFNCKGKLLTLKTVTHPEQYAPEKKKLNFSKHILLKPFNILKNNKNSMYITYPSMRH